MPKKVILDVDPGVDDAIALSMALFDPRLEVIAVTAVGGNVPAHIASRNVQAILEYLDPPRLPRIGVATEPEHGLPKGGRRVFGADNLDEAPFEVAELRSRHPAEKILCDEIRAAPESVTIVALGPLTNIARAFQRDPDLPAAVGQIIIAGGTISGPGNITPAAEFNIYCDPEAARAVFRARCTKVLVPLDLTNKVVLTFDVFNKLPAETTKVGQLLRKVLPPAFRAYRQQFGLEGIHVHDSVALMVAMEPSLFTVREMAGDVETMGELTMGMTVFDRRRVPAWRHNVGVAVEMKADALLEQMFNCLANAGLRAGKAEEI